ncbi:polyprenyl synthetase family protein [Bacillus manliponensis]|uniref:polyprenyl synthetase family protein n=1 Tax=Bacillus manliponensis TaxID=574376 RepID=UPI00068E7B6F|nr:polyprenyl synthetase family protein [Bacillus manliponensis]
MVGLVGYKEKLYNYLTSYCENNILDNEMKDVIHTLLHNRGKIFNSNDDFVWSEFYLLYSLIFINEDELESHFPIAAAIELLILATDIMDEISDNETKGENISQLGVPKALTIANALLIEAFVLLLKNRSHLDLVFDELRNASIGQWKDISFTLSPENIVTEQEYFEVINMKSSSLVRLLFKVNGFDKNKHHSLIEAATNIGIAGQLKNDATDIFVPEKNDLFHLKATLPLIKAVEYSSQHENGDLIKKLISLRETQSTEILIDIQKYIKNVGAIDYTLVLSKIHMNNAITLIEKYRNNSNSNFVEYLVNYLLR